MTGTHLPPNFDDRILTAIKGVVNTENRRLFEAWRRVEGGDARWNPLNSSLWLDGWTTLPNYNSIGVRNYAYEFAGIAATILTFASRDPGPVMRYGGIVGDLQHGAKTAEQIATDRRAEFEKWGTDVDLLLRVLAETPAARSMDDSPNYADVFKDAAGQWRFRLVAGANHETIAQSEGYKRRKDAYDTLSRYFGGYEF